MSIIVNPVFDNGERLFYIEYKLADETYSRLQRNSISNLNGFRRNFDTNEAIAGGKLTVDLRLYGSRELNLVKAWEPTATEKAPSTLNFARVTYTKNLDISYALLVFDFSESFVKNFEEDFVYYDATDRTMLDSLQVKIYVGSVNQESLNLNDARISSDYIAINSPDERVGILFTDNANVQQAIADNATISGIKYLIYNYLPKNVNGANEYIPIRLEFFVNSEDLNKLVEKNIGVEVPTNKIEEINQILSLQKQEFSRTDITSLAESKKTLYLTYLQMPITDSEILNNLGTSFEINNYLHSLQFNTMFNYNQIVSKNVKNLDFFKYGKYIFELKNEINVKDALPNRISISKNWQNPESSVAYQGFYENRSISNIFFEILGFSKYVTWLFNQENSESKQISILRQVYLNKLQKILLNMLFQKPTQTDNLKDFYQKETIYKTFYGKTYNYDTYSGQTLTPFESFLLNITVRNYLYVVDFLWYVSGKNPSKQYENKKFYSYLESHIFNNYKYYNSDAIPPINSFTPYDFDSSLELFNSYLMSIHMLFFVKNYLNFVNFSDFNNEKTSNTQANYNNYIEFNRRILFVINENLQNVKIFNPNIVTQENELFLDGKYADYATFLILLDEFLNSPIEDSNFFYNKVPRATSNYQFWHIIEKDFVLHSAKIGDSRFIMKDTTLDNLFTMLNNIDIISTMKYGFLDCVTTSNGSAISLKSRIVTNI
jgi:hypothetical protein